MGKQRRKFETEFKQQLVAEAESDLLTVRAASRKHQISARVIDRWRRQAPLDKERFKGSPTVREALERENREIKEKLAEPYLESDHLKNSGIG
jgi:transposase-like protein